MKKPTTTDMRTSSATSRRTASRRKVYAAPALEKGLDILELLAREPDSISLKDLAERLGRSVGEIFRMLAVLEQRGFVRTAPGSERYQLSMRLFQLAHWHLPVNRLTAAAAGPMRRLALKTGQSCHLATLSGGTIVILAKQDSFSDRSFSVRVGAEAPVLASCSGRILFALADAHTRQSLLETLDGMAPDAGQVEQVMALEDRLRRTLLLEIASDQVEGIIDIGTPVFGHGGQAAAALVIPFLHRIDRDNAGQLAEVRLALVEAGKAISAELGADPL